MPTTLPSMSLVLPTRGSSGSGHWADTLDTNFGLLDVHDHSSGKGVKVPSAGININADLTFNSSWAAIALNRVSFSTISAPPATTKSLFVFSDELYWKSAAGTSVKITDASSLNVAAFTGGIGGDYTAVAAELNYDDANKRYTFKQGGGTNWARLQFGGLRLVEFGTSETVYVEHLAPAALGASYSVTWPAATPGSTSIMQMDSTGAVSVSNTVGNAATFSAAVTLSGGISNTVTLTGGATAASNQHVTVSGTGAFKHGNRTLVIPASAAMAKNTGGTPAVYANAGGQTWSSVAAGNIIHFPIALASGSRIVSVDIWFNRSSGTMTFNLKRQTLSTAATTTVATTTESSQTGVKSISLSSVNHTVLSTDQYCLEYSDSDGAGVVYAVAVTYDVP